MYASMHMYTNADVHIGELFSKLGSLSKAPLATATPPFGDPKRALIWNAPSRVYTAQNTPEPEITVECVWGHAIT